MTLLHVTSVLTQISAPHCKTTSLSCCTNLFGICFMLNLKETVLLGARAEQSNTLGDFLELPVAADSTAGLARKGSSARLSMGISVTSCVL